MNLRKKKQNKTSSYLEKRKKRVDSTVAIAEAQTQTHNYYYRFGIRFASYNYIYHYCIICYLVLFRLNADYCLSRSLHTHTTKSVQRVVAAFVRFKR